MFPNWLKVFKRSPHVGEGKDRTMPHSTESPGAPVAPTETPDVSQQIAQLTEAVNRLVVQQQQQQQPAPPIDSATADIGGAIPGGHAPRAAIDVARLSPLQQITLGLRDAKPVGPARATVLHAPDTAPGNGAAPEGAD